MQKRLVCYLQCQGHSKGSYDQNMTVSTISTELDADVCLCGSAEVCWYVWMCVDVRRCLYLCNLYSMVIVVYFIELKF